MSEATPTEPTPEPRLQRGDLIEVGPRYRMADEPPFAGRGYYEPDDAEGTYTVVGMCRYDAHSVYAVRDDIRDDMGGCRVYQGADMVPVSRCTVVDRSQRVESGCAHCGAPATCYGAYEGQPPHSGCDECCGHGCEDGWCVPIAAAAGRTQRTRRSA